MGRVGLRLGVGHAATEHDRAGAAVELLERHGALLRGIARRYSPARRTPTTRSSVPR